MNTAYTIRNDSRDRLTLCVGSDYEIPMDVVPGGIETEEGFFNSVEEAIQATLKTLEA